MKTHTQDRWYKFTNHRAKICHFQLCLCHMERFQPGTAQKCNRNCPYQIMACCERPRVKTNEKWGTDGSAALSPILHWMANCKLESRKIESKYKFQFHLHIDSHHLVRLLSKWKSSFSLDDNSGYLGYTLNTFKKWHQYLSTICHCLAASAAVLKWEHYKCNWEVRGKGVERNNWP